MVKSSHAYDNIWTSELDAQQAQVGVGKSLRSGTVDLAKVMAEGDDEEEAAAAMSRQKSLRSQAFEHLSDHKPVWVDLCTTASGAPPDGGGGEGGGGAKVGPIRMSRVGGVGRTYEPGAGE